MIGFSVHDLPSKLHENYIVVAKLVNHQRSKSQVINKQWQLNVDQHNLSIIKLLIDMSLARMNGRSHGIN